MPTESQQTGAMPFSTSLSLEGERDRDHETETIGGERIDLETINVMVKTMKIVTRGEASRDMGKQRASTPTGATGNTPLVSKEEVPHGGMNEKVTVVGIMNNRVD